MHLGIEENFFIQWKIRKSCTVGKLFKLWKISIGLIQGGGLTIPFLGLNRISSHFPRYYTTSMDWALLHDYINRRGLYTIVSLQKGYLGSEGLLIQKIEATLPFDWTWLPPLPQALKPTGLACLYECNNIQSYIYIC